MNLWINLYETKYCRKKISFLCIWCLLVLVSSVQGGIIVWCLLSTVANLSGVFCPGWQKNVVSFVHPGKNSLVSFDSGVFCPTFCSCSCQSVQLKLSMLQQLHLSMLLQLHLSMVLHLQQSVLFITEISPY